ncbi:MAG: hypothetical protein MHPSP_002309, partial [Paramarteilia canceri]
VKALFDDQLGEIDEITDDEPVQDFNIAEKHNLTPQAEHQHIEKTDKFLQADYIKNYSDKMINKLKHELEILKSENYHLNSKLKLSENNLEKANQELNDFRNKYSKCIEQCQELKNVNKSLSRDLLMSQSSVEMLNKQVQNMTNGSEIEKIKNIYESKLKFETEALEKKLNEVDENKQILFEENIKLRNGVKVQDDRLTHCIEEREHIKSKLVNFVKDIHNIATDKYNLSQCDANIYTEQEAECMHTVQLLQDAKKHTESKFLNLLNEINAKELSNTNPLINQKLFNSTRIESDENNQKILRLQNENTDLTHQIDKLKAEIDDLNKKLSKTKINSKETKFDKSMSYKNAFSNENSEKSNITMHSLDSEREVKENTHTRDRSSSEKKMVKRKIELFTNLFKYLSNKIDDILMSQNIDFMQDENMKLLLRAIKVILTNYRRLDRMYDGQFFENEVPSIEDHLYRGYCLFIRQVFRMSIEYQKKISKTIKKSEYHENLANHFTTVMVEMKSQVSEFIKDQNTRIEKHLRDLTS